MKDAMDSSHIRKLNKLIVTFSLVTIKTQRYVSDLLKTLYCPVLAVKISAEIV